MVIQIKKKLNFATGKKLLDIDTTVKRGDFVAISGPSGSGKTTLLRVIAGLEKAAIGKIIINNQIWLDTFHKINLVPQKRKVGYVFQNYALFPNMTVHENLAYALEKNQGISIIEELIEMMELKALAKKYPYRLSGGQQQRVALARALVRRPPILLLDEPLSALDESMRSRLQTYILKIHQNYQLTTLMVSHDVGEIFKMADQVLVLQEGKIAQQGTPETVFINQPVRGQYQFSGVVLQISSTIKGRFVSVKTDNKIVQVPISKEEVTNLVIGDKILLYAEMLNPVIYKLMT